MNQNLFQQQVGRLKRTMPDAKKAMSDQRFRSFAERFIVTRSHLFRPDAIAADTWACILDAQRAYKMIKLVGYGRFEDAEDDATKF